MKKRDKLTYYKTSKVRYAIGRNHTQKSIVANINHSSHLHQYYAIIPCN